MGYFLVVFTTIVVVTVLISRNFKTKTSNGLKVFKLVTEINNAYLSIVKQKFSFKIFIDIILLFSTNAIAFLSIYNFININLYKLSFIFNKMIFKILIAIITFIIVFYLVGYFLLFTLKIRGFIQKTEDKNFRVDFIISYFLIMTYLTTLILFPTEFKKLSYFLFIGVILSYLLNMRMMFKIMTNPKNIKSMKEENISFSRIIVAAILILMMVLIDLFLLVVILNSLNPSSFSNVDGLFSMFYYTMITFSTIGYGDIVPLTIPARIVAITISLTSVICITIFLSSVLSYREKLK